VIVVVKIDKTSGKRSSDNSSNSMFEYFLEENSP